MYNCNNGNSSLKDKINFSRKDLLVSFSAHAQNIRTQKCLLTQSYKDFDTDIMKSKENFNAKPKKSFS